MPHAPIPPNPTGKTIEKMPVEHQIIPRRRRPPRHMRHHPCHPLPCHPISHPCHQHHHRQLHRRIQQLHLPGLLQPQNIPYFRQIHRKNLFFKFNSTKIRHSPQTCNPSSPHPSLPATEGHFIALFKGKTRLFHPPLLSPSCSAPFPLPSDYHLRVISDSLTSH